tara:strand:+ start:130 stop:306 length:177 start_codon:yes stop_codon:yes gene_type:complete
MLQEAQECSLLSRSPLEQNMEMVVVAAVQTDLVLRQLELMDLTIHLPEMVLDLVAAQP